MSSERIDYSSLLPKHVGSSLTEAAAAWRSTAEAQNAILLPLFAGVDGYKPDLFAVLSNVNSIGQAPIQLCQEIVAYARVFVSIVGTVNDRTTLATSLRVNANRWHGLDVKDLTSLDAEISHLLTYDLAGVELVINGLKALANAIGKWDSSSIDSVFNSNVFDLITTILEPVARFPATIDGVAQLADALHISMEAVKSPVKEIFSRPTTREPICTPAVASGAIGVLIERIRCYFSNVERVVTGASELVRNLTALGVDVEQIPKGIEDFASGHTSGVPAVITEAENLWTDAGAASMAYVSVVLGKSSALASTRSFSVLAGRAVAPAASSTNFQDALGPPIYAASALALLAKQIMMATTQLATVVTLPYSNSIKLVVDGADVSLFEAISQTKSMYDNIQGRTIPIARAISSYSLMQETILPILANGLPEGVPVDMLFKTWINLADSYGTEAAQVGQDCIALLEQFRTIVSTLKSNLSGVRARIQVDKQRLAEAQAAYDTPKAESLVNGILAVIFTAEAIAAACDGQGELIQELGGNVGRTLHQAIEENVKSNQLAVLLHKIEGIVTILENAAARLDSAVALVADIVSSMVKAGDLWTEVRSDLRCIQTSFSEWLNTGLLTDTILSSIATRWTTLKNSSSSYIDGVLGIESPKSLNAFAASVSGISNRTINSVDFSTAPNAEDAALIKFHDLRANEQLSSILKPSTPAQRLQNFTSIRGSMLDSQFYNAVKAPSFSLGTNRRILNNSAASYRQAAGILQSRFSSDACNLRNLAAKIANSVIPSVTDSVDFYKQFAGRQVTALSARATKAEIQGLAAENARSAAKGLQKAQASQTIVLNFKNDAVLVDNAMIQRTNELQSSVNRAQSQLQDQRGELAKYDWIKWVPGIGILIKLIIEASLHTESQIRDLQRQVADVTAVKQQVQAAKSIVGPIITTAADLTTSWSALTQEASDLSAYLGLIDEVPDTAAALVDSAKRTWDNLIDDLGHW